MKRNDDLQIYKRFALKAVKEADGLLRGVVRMSVATGVKEALRKYCIKGACVNVETDKEAIRADRDNLFFYGTPYELADNFHGELQSRYEKMIESDRKMQGFRDKEYHGYHPFAEKSYFYAIPLSEMVLQQEEKKLLEALLGDAEMLIPTLVEQMYLVEMPNMPKEITKGLKMIGREFALFPYLLKEKAKENGAYYRAVWDSTKGNHVITAKRAIVFTTLENFLEPGKKTLNSG